MANPKLNVSDRVKRAKIPGCHGIVKELRTEVTASSAEAREKSLIISVQWDNGTLSYMTPEALELVKSE